MKTEENQRSEHRINFIKKIFLDIAFDNKQLSLMKNSKKIFDPNNILNAGNL